MRTLTFMILCLLFFAAPQAWAASAEDAGVFEAGRKNYFEKNYEAAKESFEALLGKEPGNGYLLFNLGNVYHKMGETGRAIQYYEKALLMIPRVSEVHVNLDMLRPQKTQDVEQSFTDYLIGNFYFWSSYFTLSELGLLLLVMASLFWSRAFYLFLRGKKIISFRTILGVLVLVYFSIGFYLKSDVARSGQFAIVLGQTVNAYAIYMDQDKPLFELHGGTKVRIIDDHEFGPDETWLRVALPAGQKGWVRASELGVI